jgi:mannosyltransferase OCH1-like enzyme
MKTRSRAFRTDLWQWMILWSEGGIYKDMKIELTNDLSWIDFDLDELVVCIEDGDGQNTRGINNAFIAMTQYHPLALQMISAIIQNVYRRDYNEDIYAISGSHLLDIILRQ